jgi:hypothetical protein
MKRLSSILLVAAGALIGLGGFAHSFMGRLVVDQELDKFPIDRDVYTMLYVVWYFVGGCMVLFGAMILLAWFRFRRGDRSLLAVTTLIGVLYIGTGIGGFIYRREDPFQLLFVVEGGIVLFSSYLLCRASRAAN